jgi:hypothetical protein
MATTLTASQVVRSSRPEPQIPDVSLDRHVLARGRPGDVAMIDAASGRSLTFGALAGAVAGVAGGLAARGVACTPRTCRSGRWPFTPRCAPAPPSWRPVRWRRGPSWLAS